MGALFDCPFGDDGFGGFRMFVGVCESSRGLFGGGEVGFRGRRLGIGSQVGRSDDTALVLIVGIGVGVVGSVERHGGSEQFLEDKDRHDTTKGPEGTSARWGGRDEDGRGGDDRYFQR